MSKLRSRLYGLDRSLTRWLLPVVLAALGLCAMVCAQDDAESSLAEEVADQGWILHSAISDNDSWDLFVMRPDGSARRQLTDTPQYEEAGARLSPDGNGCSTAAWRSARSSNTTAGGSSAS